MGAVQGGDSLRTYQDFLESKRTLFVDAGFDVSIGDLHGALFPFQSKIVKWALKRGRTAIFADCGLGKALMALEWSRQIYLHMQQNVLILAPLAVAQQFLIEGEKFGIPITHCRASEDVCPGLNVTNYERLHHFNSDDFGAIVLDECFPPDTPIDVLSIDNRVQQKYIKDISRGDRILNAYGEDNVQETYKRPIDRAIQIRVNGRRITCSENHPLFTLYGWKCAQDLRPGDCLMATETAMRLVRGDILPEVRINEVQSVLRQILLSEMADEATGNIESCSQPGSGKKKRKEKIGVVQIQHSGSTQGNRTDTEIESDEKPGNEGKSFSCIAKEEAQTFRAWGQWSGDDIASAIFDGCVVRKLDCGICYITGETRTRFSNMLQGRLRKFRLEDCNRGGRKQSPQPAKVGQEKGREVGIFRVESVEVLEPGHPELEKYRDESGVVYFYDFKAKRHPSYSVGGILVHNSSILKAFDGHYRKQITDFARSIQYRLACTATPAPNDLIELTNHSEFLDVMTGKEIIALFFTQDGNTTHHWRLKGHAKADFWRWMASWCVALQRPSDLGFNDEDFILPPLRMHQETVNVQPENLFTLFPLEAQTLDERRSARRESLDDRISAAVELANGSDEPWIMWCNLNIESEALTKAIPGAVEIKGSDTSEHKEKSMLDFAHGKIRVLVTKPTICGFGMNWQHCSKMAFVGLSDSFEQMYQAIRRCWRFGQKRPVDVYVITAQTEGAVVRNIQRKEKQANEMIRSIVKEMRGLNIRVQNTRRDEMEYTKDEATGNGWRLLLGDCCERIDEIDTDSVGLSVFSPPFPGMYAYSNSARDIGNSTHIDEMIEHFRYLVGPEKLYRVLMPGRMCCVHLMQLTAMKNRDGYIGVKDYRGRVIQMFSDEGWRYAGEVTIDKNPQIQATRNKERGLLFKSLATDSSMMRMALADYLIYFRKPGENTLPIRAGVSKKYNPDGGWITEQEWIEWAAPVWYRAKKDYPGGIRETDVLNVRQARETDDERHLCPMQLGVIERAVKLWSAPGDLVFSPFAGVGSEGYKSIELGRRFVGIELKRSYWESAIRNLKSAEERVHTPMLFGGAI
jgi:DNA modification methylase